MPNERQWTRDVKQIKDEIAGLGPARPGSLYTRYNVCGRPGCKCGRKNNPEKHGPYYYLSYTFEGKSHTEFVRKNDLELVRTEIANYDRLMELVHKLVSTHIQLARLRKEKT